MRADPAFPLREITPTEIEQYHEAGALRVRGLLDPSWIEQIERAVVRVMTAPSPISAVFSKPEEGFHMEAGLFVSDADIQAVVLRSPLARIAQAFMGSSNVHFFYDQMFCKQAGSQYPTPWHHDITFWPVRGEQIISIWIPLDPVTRASSGLEYVRGSHRWNNQFRAVSPMYNAQLVDPAHEEMPDIDTHREDYDLVSWPMEPGDALVFHPRTVHGSSANTDLKQPRRAIAFRFLGDDVSYCPTPHTMPFPAEGLNHGDPIAEPSFEHLIAG